MTVNPTLFLFFVNSKNINKPDETKVSGEFAKTETSKKENIQKRSNDVKHTLINIINTGTFYRAPRRSEQKGASEEAQDLGMNCNSPSYCSERCRPHLHLRPGFRTEYEHLYTRSN